MSRRSKRFQAVASKVDRQRHYSVTEAIKLLKETSTVKFDAAAEAHLRLGIDPKKGEQIVRGTVILPHGSGKVQKIVAFVTPAKEKEAKEAGADIVGGKELIDQIKKDEKINFEVAVAEPAMMKDLSVIARILGQKGLMPNPKVGTVTPEIKKIITELKKGKINFKNDENGNVHIMFGRLSFTEKQLQENFLTFIEALKKAKPETVKGTYFNSVVIASSMGPGIKVNI